MNTNTIVGVVLGVVIIGGGAYYFLNAGSSNTGMPDMPGMSAEEMANMTPPASSGMLAEENAVMVSDQRPGTTVSGMVVLAAPGYLVIHADNSGKPGAVLGSSALLRAGENANVKVALSRASRDGEVLYAMLHTDDGDGAFSASSDALVQSRLGGPIQGMFETSSSASADTPISL